MYDFPIQPLLDQIRVVMKAAYGLPDEAIIPVSGNPPVDLQNYTLPMGWIDTGDGASISRGGGEALKSLNVDLTASLWIIRDTTAGDDDTAELTALLVTLTKAIEADPGMAGTATDSSVVGMNWAMPKDEEEEAYGGGYITCTFHIEDQ